MRSNSITEHFPKIIKDYMVTSFTGQKLDQTFGDQYWEFTDEGGLMKVLEAICDVAEDALKKLEELEEQVEEKGTTSEEDLKEELEDLNGIITDLTSKNDQYEIEIADLKAQLASTSGSTEPKKRAPRADKGKSRKKCVACEGSGKNSKGEDCPICKEVMVEPNSATTVDPAIKAHCNALIKEVFDSPPPFAPDAIAPTSTPPWLAQPAAPAAPAFFPPPPPPPYWNPNA